MSGQKWNLDECLEKLCPRGPEQLSVSFGSVAGKRIQAPDVTDQMLEESYIIMAKVIKAYGEEYLPIFERLHEERESRRKKEAMLEAALKASIRNPEL